MKNLIICSARYSDNLGDGVIADCAEYLVRRVRNDLNVMHFDLAGRTDWSPPKLGEGEQIKAPFLKNIFYKIPAQLQPLATAVAWRLFMRKKLKSAWRAMDAKPGSSLIFAGGQLWNDVALNFPLKIEFVHQQLAASGGAFAVGPVGVSKNWSSSANRILSRVTKAARSVWVRDRQSAETLNKYTGVNVQVTFDSAICASDCYGLNARSRLPGLGAVVGVGVASPAELATQAENPDEFGKQSALRFWVDLLANLKKSGLSPVIFTNGAQEDEAFAAELHALAPDVPRANTPRKPIDLVNLINSFDSLVSYRLHANIIAYSCGVPSVGLVWDSKVRNFAGAVGREAYCLTPPFGVNEVMEKLLAAMSAGIDFEQRQKNKSACEESFVKIVNSVI